MFRVEPIQHDDVHTTAELHAAYLRLGLFPKMGKRFLARYHRTFIDSPHAVALIARNEDGRIVGMLLGTTSNAEHYRWVMRHHGASLALRGAGALMLRPPLAFEFMRTRLGRYARGIVRNLGPHRPESGSSGPKSPNSVLTHIACADGYRRRGIGRGMVAQFKGRARAEGASRACLITRESGPGAPFFERIGCKLVAHRQERDGQAVCEFHLDLDGAAPPARFVEYPWVDVRSRSGGQRLRPVARHHPG